MEGDTDDPAVIALRGRQMRNFMVALLVSQGTPMVLAGALQPLTMPSDRSCLIALPLMQEASRRQAVDSSSICARQCQHANVSVCA